MMEKDTEPQRVSLVMRTNRLDDQVDKLQQVMLEHQQRIAVLEEFMETHVGFIVPIRQAGETIHPAGR
jgi:hypothetical protein